MSLFKEFCMEMVGLVVLFCLPAFVGSLFGGIGFIIGSIIGLGLVLATLNS